MTLRKLLLVAMVLLVAACARQEPRIINYVGPPADNVVIWKSQRLLGLYSGATHIKSYRIELGFQPVGHKEREGDGKTPEGRYWIDRRNSDSAFHLSLGISYPNAEDRARAKDAGVDPGGDIFIHGQPRGEPDVNDPDWTAGCIAVKNSEIEEIYAMVPDGAWVTILP